MTTFAPPGPDTAWFGLPLLRRMAADYLGFTQDLQRRHGDLVRMRLGFERTYDVFAPDLVREVLVDKAGSFIRWERGIEVFAQSMGRSVLTTEGETWQRQRRLLQPVFAARRVAGYAATMVAATQRALDALPPEMDDQRVDIEHWFTGLTMDVIMHTLFSSTSAADARAVGASVQTLSRVAMREMFRPWTLPDWLPLPGKAAKRRALRLQDELVWRHIRQRQQQGAAAGHDDILAHLLVARDGDVRLSEREVRDQCVTIFQAGHETSATALTWWSWLMAAHPACQQRVADELQRVLGGRAPGHDDVAALPYLGQTLKEAMRLYPPAAGLMTRRAIEPVTIGGWPLPKGAMLRITPWVLHHDARWFPEPERFLPERFGPGAPDLPRGAYLPFGTGPRVCIGSLFASTEMTLVAALLLQRFELSAMPGMAPPRAVLNVTLRPAEPLRLQLRRRQPSSAATSSA